MKLCILHKSQLLLTPAATPGESCAACQIAGLGNLLRGAGFVHGPAAGGGEGAFVMIHLETMEDADAVANTLTRLAGPAKLGRRNRELVAAMHRLEGEIRRIKHDANILCGCLVDRDSLEKLGRVQDAASQVEMDASAGRTKDDRFRMTDRLGAALQALLVYVREFEGEEVPEDDYLAVYGELPAARPQSR